MPKAGGNSEIFTDRNSVGDGDFDSGSTAEQTRNTKRMASPIETSLAKIEDVGSNNGNDEDIDKWVSSLERLLEDVPSYMCSLGHPGRISRIPENLREVDVKSYEPYILSIGPYHHGKVRVQHMEMRKKLVLKCVLRNNPELTLKDYLKEIVSIEATARSFYSDIEMESENFVRMLLLDSVYIVTTFCGMAKGQERINARSEGSESRVDNDEENVGAGEINEYNGNRDYNENLNMIVSTDESADGRGSGENWFWVLFPHNIFLIENQIPFFVLQKIYNFVYGGSETQFMDIMKYEVANMLVDYTKQDSKTVILGTEEVHHLLHLCHMFFRPTIQQESTDFRFPESNQMFRLGSAVQLYDSGVHFETRSCSGDYSLLDITFDGSGKLAMPCLLVDDNTESLIRNLVALEQMKYPSLGLDISSYIVFLLHLITTPKDVELLRRKGIIQHHLSSDKEMMYLINRLSIGLAFDYVEDRYSLKNVFHQLKHYSERRVPQWKAWLKHRHFRNTGTLVIHGR